jgi:hypothetical protein
MSKLTCAGATTLAIFSSIGFAAAQRGPGANRPNLTPTQERTVSQRLAASPFTGRVGRRATASRQHAS